jgi:hypothetical protein
VQAIGLVGLTNMVNADLVELAFGGCRGGHSQTGQQQTGERKKFHHKGLLRFKRR